MGDNFQIFLFLKENMNIFLELYKFPNANVYLRHIFISFASAKQAKASLLILPSISPNEQFSRNRNRMDK